MKADPSAQPSLTKLEQAQALFREYYAQCFWHLKPDLVVSDQTLPIIVEGLRRNGDRQAMLAADELLHWPQGEQPCP